MAIVIAYLGVGVVAIPTGIISAGFVEQYHRKSSISDWEQEDTQRGSGGHDGSRLAGKYLGRWRRRGNVSLNPGITCPFCPKKIQNCNWGMS